MYFASRSPPFHDLGHCRFADTKLLGNSDLCFARVLTFPNYGNFLLQSQVAMAHYKAGKLAQISTGLASHACHALPVVKRALAPLPESGANARFTTGKPIWPGTRSWHGAKNSSCGPHDGKITLHQKNLTTARTTRC